MRPKVLKKKYVADLAKDAAVAGPREYHPQAFHHDAVHGSPPADLVVFLDVEESSAREEPPCENLERKLIPVSAVNTCICIDFQIRPSVIKRRIFVHLNPVTKPRIDALFQLNVPDAHPEDVRHEDDLISKHGRLLRKVRRAHAQLWVDNGGAL